MIHIVLFGYTFKDEDKKHLIGNLWRAVLCKDPKWHFFWEGEYTFIRCSDEFKSEVTGALDTLEQKYSVTDNWEDNIPITKKYQELFELAFHAFSEFAVQAEADDLRRIYERIMHCFLNPQYINTSSRSKADSLSYLTYGIMFAVEDLEKRLSTKVPETSINDIFTGNES